MTAKTKKTISFHDVSSMLSYDPSTGHLSWKVSRGSRARVGNVAGNVTTSGYVSIMLYKQNWLAHRLIWLLMTGEHAPEEIDHINHVRSDNRWENLRLCSIGQNAQNRTIQSNNSSGYTGVSWSKTAKKWHAYIKSGRVRVTLGYFDSIEVAAAAYATAKREKHTFHPSVVDERCPYVRLC